MQVTLKSKPSDSPKDSRTGESLTQGHQGWHLQEDYRGMEQFPCLTGKRESPAKRTVCCIQNLEKSWSLSLRVLPRAEELRSFQKLHFGTVSVGQHFSFSGSLGSVNYTRYKTCLGIVGINHCALLFQEKKVLFHIKEINLILSNLRNENIPFKSQSPGRSMLQQGRSNEGRLLEVGGQVGDAVKAGLWQGTQGGCEGTAVQVICYTDYAQISCKARFTAQVFIPMPALQSW